MTEYGIFNDEGCIDAGMYSEAEAHRASVTYIDDESAWIAPICEDHAEQPAHACEECMAEMGDEDESDDQ